jgi:tryptophanyl-tRNA synthetase
MSKSYDNCLYISDPPDVISKKILTMVTDPHRMRRTDKGNPELCPVFDLHKLHTPSDKLKEIDSGCRTAGIGCVDCKKVVIEEINMLLTPIREKREHLIKQPDILEEIIKNGNKKALAVSSETIKEVKQAIRIIYDFRTTGL